jgi:hypothetical protein
MFCWVKVLLKEGLGTHVPSYGSVCQLVIAITNGQEETDDASHIGAPIIIT